jgi:hypothetical protein
VDAELVRQTPRQTRRGLMPKRRKKPKYAAGGLVISGGAINFLNGGTVIGRITANTANITSQLQRINAAASSMTHTFGLASQKFKPDEPPACGARRGGPDSKVFCEIWENVEHKTHMGRGRSKWFSWD